eukprot:365751-Chlamydomonas_euryale.AAC.10
MALLLNAPDRPAQAGRKDNFALIGQKGHGLCVPSHAPTQTLCEATGPHRPRAKPRTHTDPEPKGALGSGEAFAGCCCPTGANCEGGVALM